MPKCFAYGFNQYLNYIKMILECSEYEIWDLEEPEMLEALLMHHSQVTAFQVTFFWSC